MTWFQPNWIHAISESALALAILILGVVIMLELRSIRSMKRNLDTHLARVFEQLDLLRLDQSAGQSAQEPLRIVPVPVAAVAPLASLASSGSNPYATAAAMASSGMGADEIARRCGLAAGEARLLASLAAAKSGRRDAA
ncbi:MAG TPA: DUF2802 domain-containing protein [Steroidobacteraceae bacterium]|jgi:hypothetical protein|nr:DUF2802 domain-containing protein [Steroidobacteraceae bacterium]